jgi:signal transduction histidine kinase
VRLRIQTKITLLFTLLCTLIIVSLSFGVYYFTYQNASQDFNTRLQLRANLAARAYLQTSADTAAFASIKREQLKRLPEEREYIIWQDTLARANRKLAAMLPTSFFNSVIQKKEAAFRKDFDFFYGLSYHNADRSYIVVVTAKNAFLKDFLNNLKKILITTCIVSIVVVFSIGLLFSKQILYPIRSISKQVNNITATSLHKRVSVKNGRDEIAVLGATFNDMLARLETSFETQNNFVSNASHELNTPLTSIIGEADYALSKQRTADDYRQSLSVILQQSEKLQKITYSLVQLARSAFRESFTTEPVFIIEILESAKKNVQQIYNACPVELNTSLYPEKATMVVSGNPQLLELALSNVIMNACKYSNGQPVQVALAVTAAYVLVIVKDTGIGIPESEVDQVFNPFFRASNVQRINGYGIGLPLTQNIIRLHRGNIHITSIEGKGTEVIIKLPTHQ